MFTFFYAMIQFNPEKIADNIQRRWWFIPWIRPWEETAKYISWMIKHLCLWWWAWLWFIWIYSYILSYLPFVKDAAVSLWSIPVVVTWSWVVIIVWVVQDLLNKINADLLMEGYEKI
jgi:preprotein translocase subunit SecY